MHRFALCAVLAACGSSEPTKIENGTRHTYEMDLAALPDKRAALEQAARVMRKRLDAADITGVVAIERETIVVDLAASSAEANARARDLIGRTARFEIKAVDHEAPYMREVYTRARSDNEAGAAQIDAEIDKWQPDRLHMDHYLVARSRDDIERYLRSLPLKHGDDRHVAFELMGDRRWRTYLVDRAPRLTSAAIAKAFAQPDPNTNRPSIRLTLNDAGAQAFAELTKQHVNKKVALIIDDRVSSAPIIMEPITNGKVTLTLGADTKPGEARDLAIALASGPLPTPVVEQSVAMIKNGHVVAPPQ